MPALPPSFILLLVALIAQSNDAFMRTLCLHKNPKIIERHKKHDAPAALNAVDKRFIPDGVRKLLDEGRLTAAELDKLFAPSKQTSEYIQGFGSSGYVTSVFNLETALVDVRDIWLYAYKLVGSELRQEEPSGSQINDVIGSTFKDAVLTLGWKVAPQILEQAEIQFYKVIEKLLEALQVRPVEGAVDMINALLDQGNKLTVVSSLPRTTAILVLKKAGLSPIFQGRVDPELLITLNDYEEYRDSYLAKHKTLPSGLSITKWQLLRSLTLLRVPTCLTVYVDGNRLNLQLAKRMSLSTIAMRGFSRDPFALRSGDKVLDNFSGVKALDFYNLIRRAIAYADGPAVQKQTEMTRVRDGGGLKTKTISPYKDDRPRRRSTADVDDDNANDSNGDDDG